MFEYNQRQRQRRKEINRLENEMLLDDTPDSIIEQIREAFADPRHNKKRIAREYGLPHSFIMWLWTHG